MGKTLHRDLYMCVDNGREMYTYTHTHTQTRAHHDGPSLLADYLVVFVDDVHLFIFIYCACVCVCVCMYVYGSMRGMKKKGEGRGEM